MPIIGIIGGSGPESTIDFQLKLYKAMREKLYPTKDQDFYRVITDNNSQTPDRNAALLKGDISPLLHWKKSINLLEAYGANILIIPCNTAHAYYEELQSFTHVPIINMIEETVKHIDSNYKNIKKVGLLSTIAVSKLNLYRNLLLKKSIDVVLPNEGLQIDVHKAIYGIKAGYHLMNSSDSFFNGTQKYPSNQKQKNLNTLTKSHTGVLPLEVLKEALKDLKLKEINHIILGCTELSLCIKQEDFKDFVLIDPSIIVASRCIEMVQEM